MTNRMLLATGKTKKIFDGGNNTCIVQNQNAITAHNDPSFTKEFSTKAQSATTTTCHVFQLLKDAGMPVAFREQMSPTEFRASFCTMIPLECIARRYVEGSFRNRRPDLPKGHRFYKIELEFFLKTTAGKITEYSGSSTSDILKVDDPIVLNPDQLQWSLRNPSLPYDHPESANIWKGEPYTCEAARMLFNYDAIVQDGPPDSDSLEFEVDDRILEIKHQTKNAFLILEAAWSLLGFRLIDFKIEFGVDSEGDIVIADVIDNDSWRLQTNDGREMSKQLFRDGHNLAEVEASYAYVAQLVQRMRIPRQAIVFWDALDIAKNVGNWKNAGVTTRSVEGVLPESFDSVLSSFQQTYPDGGVILTQDPRVALYFQSKCHWPVLYCVDSVDDSSDQKPRLVFTGQKHEALNYAMVLLSGRNPVAYTCANI